MFFSQGSCGKPNFADMKKESHHIIYLGLLILFVVFLPTSKYMTSLVQILMLIHFLIRGSLISRLKKAFSRTAVWIFLLLFTGHALAMIYTSDLAYGLHDLKIKLPLLVLPIIIASSERLTAGEVKLVLLLFVAAVFASSLVSTAALLGWIPVAVEDFREASLFISHIRFALLVDMALFVLTFFALRPGGRLSTKILYYLIALYFAGFLILSKSMTGIVVAILVGILLSLRWIIMHSGSMAKWFAIVGVVTIPVLISAYIGDKVSEFYTPKDDLENLDQFTVQGNIYWHDTSNLDLENGYRVGLYWCEKEMESEWNKRSDFNYTGSDLKGQDIKFTLIRYLTSLGYRKDAYGVQRLDDRDVSLIEHGFANSNYRNKNRFHNRIYEIIWQVDIYKRGGNPSGHSLTQRIEFLKTGWAIFKQHWIFGVGTGDLQSAFEEQYNKSSTPLAQEWQLRAHNQWLTFAVAMGVIGFLLMVIAFFAPAIIERGFTQYLFLLFFTIAFISMFNEDTLETQAGVAFIAFFYPLLLFSVPHEGKIT